MENVATGVVEVYRRGSNVFLVVRRDERTGYKAGALNNVVYLADKGLLGELAGKPGWKPDYLVVVDGDQAPSRNPLIELLSGKHRSWPTNPLDQEAYRIVRERLLRYEEVGKRILGYPGYKLDPEKMDDPRTFLTRLVELIEYHRRFVPELVAVQVQQTHLPAGSPVAPSAYASYRLAHWAMVLRSPRIELAVDGVDSVYGEVVVAGKILGWLYDIVFHRFFHKIIRRYAVGGVRVDVSRHLFPILMGSGAIIAFDVVKRYRFADGVFVPYVSVTEDLDFSTRIQRDGYLVSASQQAETYASPPDSYTSLLRQQHRWAYGTFADFRRHARSVYGSPRLTWTEKFGYTTQLLYYLGEPLLLAAVVALACAIIISPELVFAPALTVIAAGFTVAETLPELFIGAPPKLFLTRLAERLTLIKAYIKALIDYARKKDKVTRDVTRKLNKYML